MNLLFVLHDVPKISWKIKDKKYFMSLHFSTLKNSQMENNDAICCSLSFQVGYCIWHIWPAVFEFDRPDICEGGVLERWIEQNGLKLWGPMCLKGCGTPEYVCVCLCLWGPPPAVSQIMFSSHQAIHLSVSQFR